MMLRVGVVVSAVMLPACFSTPGLSRSDGGAGSDGSGSDGSGSDGTTDAPILPTCTPGEEVDVSTLPNLLFFYRLDEASGTTAEDASTNNFDATLNVTRTTGHRNMGVMFGGGTDVIDAGARSEFRDLGAITVCAWVRPTIVPDGAANIVDKSGQNGLQGGWNFYIQPHPSMPDGFIRMGFFTRSHDEKLGATKIAVGDWVHLCATWNGGGNTAGLTLYINGFAESQFIRDSDSSDSEDSDMAANVLIGRGNGPGSTYPYVGGLDEVALFDRVLTATEILAIFNCGF